MSLETYPDFTLEAVFESMAALPVFPKIVHEAFKVLDDPNKKIIDVAKIIKYDVGLVANILKLTNSALFGLRQQISDLETALTLLGQQKIREVLMTSAALPYLTRTLYGYEMSPEDLWLHSIGCALVSEIVSERFKFENTSSLYTAALLHDIGKIVLDMHLGLRLLEVLDHSRQSESDFSMAEWNVLGTDHAVAGSAILKQWDFPPDIYRAVRNHHDPDLYIQDELSALLAFCNILTVQLGVGVGANAFRYRVAHNLLEKISCSEEDFMWCIENSVIALEKARQTLKMVFS